MDFDLSKPQKMLQGSVKEFLSRHCSLERVRELMETPTGFDAELWEGLTDQGWTSLTLPEAYEGLELGAVELVAVTEAMGCYCMPGPFVSNLWGAELIAASGNDDYAKQVLPGVADGETKLTVALLEESGSWDPADCVLAFEEAGDGAAVSGDKLFVSDAEVADIILVIGRLGGELAVVAVPRDADGVTVEAMPAIDATRKLYKVAFAQAGGNVVARGDITVPLMHVWSRGDPSCCGETPMTYTDEHGVEHTLGDLSGRGLPRAIRFSEVTDVRPRPGTTSELEGPTHAIARSARNGRHCRHRYSGTSRPAAVGTFPHTGGLRARHHLDSRRA